MYLFTSIIGNVLEWFDFVLYGCFAYIFMKLYFPSENAYTSSVLAFSVFALGFIARPLGGIIFGYIGDRYGRKLALTYSVVLITIPTTIMGVLPTYETLGIVAPLLLVFMRLVQGFAVSGELTGSGIYLYECAPKNIKNMYGSLLMSSTYIGLFLGTLIVIFISIFFSEDEIKIFAWRLPFIFSFFLGILAIYLRINCEETPLYLKTIQRRETLDEPIKVCLKYYKKEMSMVFFVCSILALGIYLLIGYLPSHFQIVNKISVGETMKINIIGLIVLIVLTPLMGKLADKIGNLYVFSLGLVGFLLLSLKIFLYINTPSIYNAIISEIIIAISLAPIAGSIISIMSELFPANIRYTAVSVSYNLSMVIFGGTAPLIITLLNKSFGSSSSVAYYYMTGSLISFIAIMKINKHHKINIFTDGRESLL